MEIMKVNVYPVNGKSNLKAFVSINLDDEIVIKNLKVVEGKNGLFVSMPSEKAEDGKYYDAVYCLNQDTRDYVQEKVLDAYEVEVSAPKKSRSRK
jgi:stage V sporulation protein G